MPVTEKQEPIQKCFKSLEYIAKFVIQSRYLFACATGGQSEDSFVVDIHLVFNSVNKMMSSTNDTVLQVLTKCIPQRVQRATYLVITV